MNFIESLILGLVQGLTEFLPVSSSAHLVIFESFLKIKTTDLVFEVLVHFGTMIAVIVYFRKKLARIIKAFFVFLFSKEKSEEDEFNVKIVWFLIVGSLPAGLVGIFLEDFIERAFAAPRWTSAMLIVTASVLFLTKTKKEGGGRINLWRTVLIGLSQAIAIMPGISRSGSTISFGIFSGMKQSEAAEFSFLLSLPAILGATVLQIPDFLSGFADAKLLISYFAGAFVSFVAGYIAIGFLMRIVKTGRFFYFGIYCALIGILGIIFL